ncbi:sugar-binding protein [Streptomyces sp. TLI_146]|uniref:sugar-binding protein n=1 Tax=Streptomyces sp. TLI_146 TaxID=1938858 RepID=UPI000CB41A88|nr:sugar-binding protein [Streptomyces sp. TLI_146]PKV83220.1 GlcNAc-PI de-N-acetylase [Streptomyces sp. TLI_146]
MLRCGVRQMLWAGCTALGMVVSVLPLAAETARAVPAPTGSLGRTDPAHTDVLFVGAHPDDESSSLATFGQWQERRGLSTGVVTITRGEGGGNAVGTEEGAALGLIREGEERKAVRRAGIRNVFYLDKPDFWYTLSAPLTATVWNPSSQPATDTLSRLVRLIRATTPREVVVMDPRPFRQHGGHQEAARLAVEAFRLAGDPTAFPGQITREKYAAWKPSRLLATNGGFPGPVGEKCSKYRAKDPHTGLPVIGVWTGTTARRHAGKTWAQIERDATREYATQGFAALPPTVETPRAKLPCEWFTVLADSRTPQAPATREQPGLRPLYADFRAWAQRMRMPWLANDAQPAYPANPSASAPSVAEAPVVDGVAGPGEYPGPALRLSHWEGQRCADEKDCAADVRFSRRADDLYVFVRVTDDIKGYALDAAADCKRHWRTDAVEIALDPQGRSDDTSTTFKTGILPFTKDGGGPCAERDADNRQGPASRTAPDLAVASAVTDPYKGYAVEVRIPLDALPAPADPERLAVNILLYDSDTADRTGQTRLAWSPFGSAQADPYVWGTLSLPGYVPPPDQPVQPARIPQDAARSSRSTASVEQARRTGVPLAGGPRRPRQEG